MKLSSSVGRVVLLLLAIAWTARAGSSKTTTASPCFVDNAIYETNLCSNVFREHITGKAFNASNPKDVRDACCLIDRLERCLQAAASNAGCKEEVSVLVSSLIRVARRTFGDVYNTKCRFNCNAAGLVTASPFLLAWVTLSLTALYRRWSL